MSVEVAIAAENGRVVATATARIALRGEIRVGTQRGVWRWLSWRRIDERLGYRATSEALARTVLDADVRRGLGATSDPELLYRNGAIRLSWRGDPLDERAVLAARLLVEHLAVTGLEKAAYR